MASSVKRVLPICSRGSAPSNKIAVMPIYGGHTNSSSPESKKALGLNLGIQHRGLKFYQVCSNDDPRLTFDLFTARSNSPCICMEKTVEKSFS